MRIIILHFWMPHIGWLFFCDVLCTGGCGQKVRKMMVEIEKANLKELSQHYKASYNEIFMLNKEDHRCKNVEYAL